MPYHDNQFYVDREIFAPPPGFSLKGKIALVTGGSSGVGHGIATELCRLGATVVITARSESRAQHAAEGIMRDCGGSGGSVHGMDLECKSLADVRRFAADFLDKYPQLNMLVLNSGMFVLKPSAAGSIESLELVGDRVELTDEGYAPMYIANYLGPFLLLNLLLPALEKSGSDARITVTSSSMHWCAQNIDELLPSSRSARTSMAACTPEEVINVYANTKLALVLMCFELQRRLLEERTEPDFSPITVTPVDPGQVASQLYSSDRGVLWESKGCCSSYLSRREGAQTTLYALLAVEMAGANGYFVQPAYSPLYRQTPLLGAARSFHYFGQVFHKYTFGIYKWLPSPEAHQREFGTRLWEASAQAVGLDGLGA